MNQAKAERLLSVDSHDDPEEGPQLRVLRMFNRPAAKPQAGGMNSGSLFVLTDGESGDAALARCARVYADEKECSVTLLRVLPVVTRAFRTDRGALILPWQAMQVMKAAAKFDLDRLREQFLSGRAQPTKTLVRFGKVVDEVAAACYAEHPQAILARSRPLSFLPWRNRDRRLLRRLAAPVLLMDGSDRLPRSIPDKVQTIYRLPVFAGMSRKELEAIARNLDEAEVAAGTTLIHEGKPNLALWIVAEGELALTLRGKLLERIKAPGLAGIPSMLDGRPAWATVTAVTRVRALVASKEQFRVLRSNDRVAMRLWAATGARLRHHILESMTQAG
jgi:CRP-like cAMP-binding protein